MKRMFFAMMFGVLVLPVFSFNANAHERGRISGPNGLVFGLNFLIGGGTLSHSSGFFFPHNPRIFVVPGGIYFQGRHHRPSHSHFEERHHGSRIWEDTHVSSRSHHKRQSHTYFDRRHHDHSKKHQRHSRSNRNHHYR